MRAAALRTVNHRPRVRRRMTGDTYASPTHAFIDRTDDAILLQTVPTGEAVARRHLEAAKDLNCSREVRKHFARCYNEQRSDE